VYPHGRAVNLSGDKPRPASYSIHKHGDASRSRPYTKRPCAWGLGGSILRRAPCPENNQSLY
ncbi:MAG: hypothetical protein LBH43_19845, partial [Treponema sp.]|nr:hypothetical protein [Treponema sp.]